MSEHISSSALLGILVHRCLLAPYAKPVARRYLVRGTAHDYLLDTVQTYADQFAHDFDVLVSHRPDGGRSQRAMARLRFYGDGAGWHWSELADQVRSLAYGNKELGLDPDPAVLTHAVERLQVIVPPLHDALFDIILDGVRNRGWSAVCSEAYDLRRWAFNGRQARIDLAARIPDKGGHPGGDLDLVDIKPLRGRTRAQLDEEAQQLLFDYRPLADRSRRDGVQARILGYGVDGQVRSSHWIDQPTE